MVNGKKPSTLTINPFVSEEQRKACYAANDPNWDCDEWNDKTPSSIPKKKKGTENMKRSFLQWLGDMWRTDNQGRHPISGTYQNMPHASARRGFQHTGQADVSGSAAVGYDSDDSEDQGDDDNDSTDLETTIKAAVSAGDNGHVGEETAAALTGEPAEGEVNKTKLGPRTIHNNFFSSPQEASTTALHGSLGKDDEARDHALKAHDASKEGNSDKASRFHGKAAEAHEAMATQARKDKEPDQADANDRSAALHRTAASMHQATTNRKGGTAMGRTYNREESIQFLTTNCDCWKEDGSETVLNEYSDDRIKTLVAAAQVVNAAKNGGVMIGGKLMKLTFNAEDNNFDMKSVPKPKSLQVGSKGGYKDNFNDNQDGEDDSEMEGEDSGDGKKVKNAEAGINRWLDDVEAPPEMRAFVENARRQEQSAKLEIAQRITNNVARSRGWDDEERIEFGEHLMRNKSLDDLREMEMLLPPARNGGNERRPSFVGNGFSPRQPVGNAGDRGGLRIVDSTETLEDPGSMTDFVRNENNRNKQTA